VLCFLFPLFFFTCSPRILKLTELGGVVVWTLLVLGTSARHESCSDGMGRTRRMTWLVCVVWLVRVNGLGGGRGVCVWV
jgi:hypothetical protein